MIRSEREAFDKRQVQFKIQNRQSNVSHAEGFIHVSKGKRYYKNGVGQPRSSERKERQ